MRFDSHVNIEVAFRPVSNCRSVFVQSNSRAVVNASWYFKGNLLFLINSPSAMTNTAVFLGYLAATVTSTTNTGLLDIAENGPGNINYLSLTVTSITSF